MQGDDILMTMEPRLAAQRHAFLRDGAPTMQQRKAALRRLRSAILAQRVALAAAVSADFGHRSPYETDILEILVTVQAIDYLLRNLKRFMKPERRHVALPYQAARAYVQYQPKGVIGIMAPWNYPFSLTFIPLATALAAGNRVMLKPSELTPHTSRLIETMLAALFPADEVAVVTGGPDVGARFSELAFDHLVFTGSTAIGRQVMQAAGKHLVPLTLELGGKSPAVMARGAVNARNVQSVAFGKLSNAGQTCIAPDYLLVHQDDLASFMALYDAAVKTFYPDGPTSDDYGAIINDRHYHRLHDLLADAQARGAQIIPVGHRPDSASERPKTLAPRWSSAPPTTAGSCKKRSSGRCCRCAPTPALMKRSTLSTPGRARWRCTTLARQTRSRIGCWRAPPPATSASTPPCCTSLRTTCRSAASAPAAWEPVTASRDFGR